MHESRKEHVRQMILDAACELMLKEGAAACTVRRVATQVDYSPMALYAYFPSKPALLRAVATELASRFEQHLRVQMQAWPAGRDQVRSLLCAYVAFGHQRQQEYDALLPAASPVLLDLLTEAVMGMLPSRIRTADVAARAATVLWAGAHGAASLPACADPALALEAVETILTGCEARLAHVGR